MLNNFLFRIVLTILIFYLFYLLNVESLLLLVLVIIILDTSDCGIWNLFNNSYNCKSFEYQKYDKIFDVATYIIFIIIFNKLFTSIELYILSCAIIWRAIGVAGFYYTNNNAYLMIFPDLVKELILIKYVRSKFELNIIQSGILISSVVFLKVIYEMTHHHSSYK